MGIFNPRLLAAPAPSRLPPASSEPVRRGVAPRVGGPRHTAPVSPSPSSLIRRGPRVRLGKEGVPLSSFRFSDSAFRWLSASPSPSIASFLSYLSHSRFLLFSFLFPSSCAGRPCTQFASGSGSDIAASSICTSKHFKTNSQERTCASDHRISPEFSPTRAPPCVELLCSN